MNFNHPVRELMWMVGGNIPLTLEQQNMHTARSNNIKEMYKLHQKAYVNMKKLLSQIKKVRKQYRTTWQQSDADMINKLEHEYNQWNHIYYYG